MPRIRLLLVGLTLATAACAPPREPGSGSSPAPTAVTVSLLAGDALGATGHRDGIGPDARFAFPLGVASGATGHVYVADHGNHAIRKVAPDGVVTTLAGDIATPASGHRDGQGAGATFNGPTSVAVDAAGNVYVADTFNHCIRKVTPAGVVTTLAGDITSAVAGHRDGRGASARFSGPNGVAVGPDGSVYVADGGNHCIRRIAPDGATTTLAGDIANPAPGHLDGRGPLARFNSPNGLALDAAGNVFVTDSDNHCIRKITPAGDVTTLAGDIASAVAGSRDGAGAIARFLFPSGLAVATDGDVYVSDYGNHRIRRVTRAGAVTTLRPPVSGYNAHMGMPASLKFPHGVAFATPTSLYVADYGTNCIRTISW